MAIQTVGFANCCGASINHAFSGSSESVEKELINYTKSRLQSGVGVNLVALNDGQKLTYHDVMEKVGYKLVVNGAHNANHDSRIYVYAYVFRPEKSEANLFPGGGGEVDY